MSQEIDTLMPHDLINAKPVSRGGEGVLRELAALAVHGPDEPAQRGHAQAPSLGARARRSHARARGLRGARRSPDALRPHLPDRDAGRSEHRPHRVALDVRARQRVRLRRDAVPQGRRRPRHRRGELVLARSRRRASTSPRPPAPMDEKGKFKRDARLGAPQRRLPDGHARHDRAHGRGAEPDGVASPPRSCPSSSTTTRTAPSWAPTCSARPCRSSARHAPLVGTGMEERARARLRRLHRRAPRRHRRERRRDAHRRPRRGRRAPRSRTSTT